VEGARQVGDTQVDLKRVPELVPEEVAKKAGMKLDQEAPIARPEELADCDGIIIGTPTRYGNMAAQLKQFIDMTGPLWLEGALEDRAAGVFTSTATTHGGQESTILTTLVPLVHLGMVFVGSPYGQNKQLMTTAGVGGSPYGPGTLAGPDGSRQPVEEELQGARNLGSRIAHVAAALLAMRTAGIEKILKLVPRHAA
jgi:NAD(P)H dehydrogenase (quinone)